MKKTPEDAFAEIAAEEKYEHTEEAEEAKKKGEYTMITGRGFACCTGINTLI